MHLSECKETSGRMLREELQCKALKGGLTNKDPSLLLLEEGPISGYSMSELPLKNLHFTAKLRTS